MNAQADQKDGSGLEDAPQASDQRRCFLAELRKTVAYDAIQHPVAGARQFEQDCPPVLSRICSCYEPALLETVGQLHHRVVLELQLRSNFFDGRLPRVRHSCQGEQKLILLRLQSRTPGRVFSTPQKTSELIPELGQFLVLVL